MSIFKKNIDESDKAKIIELYKQGYGYQTIAIKTHISSGPVERFLKKSGFTRTREEALAMRIKLGRYKS